MQTNEEGKTVVTGIIHSSRLGMLRNKKVVVHKMNNITDEVLSWIQDTVKFCNYCSCDLSVIGRPLLAIFHEKKDLINCKPHFVKTFPKDIDDHCPGLLHDEIGYIDMKHQDITTFTLESILRFKYLRALDFSFNNLTELHQIDETFEFDRLYRFNFSHNQIVKTDGFFDKFMDIEEVDLSSNPTTSIFTQSPVIANRIQYGYIELGNFTTYFGNENEVRPILDEFCTHHADLWGDYRDTWDDCILAEDKVLDLSKCIYDSNMYQLRCWVKFNPNFQVGSYLFLSTT